jgi:hypothetical protein
MKLSEIKLIPPNPSSVFRLPENVIATATIIGKSDHREVFSASFSDRDGEHYSFFNKDSDGAVISFVIVNERHIFDRDVAEVIRSWTRDDLRSKGYVSALLKFIRDFTKMSIISDKEQTPYARDFWRNVARKFHVQMIDMTTGDLYDADEAKVYSEKDPDAYRLFVESYEFIIGQGKVPNKRKSLKEWVDPSIIPYIYFEDGDI